MRLLKRSPILLVVVVQSCGSLFSKESRVDAYLRFVLLRQSISTSISRPEIEL